MIVLEFLKASPHRGRSGTYQLILDVARNPTLYSLIIDCNRNFVNIYSRIIFDFVELPTAPSANSD